jgi:hypothetical protein
MLRIVSRKHFAAYSGIFNLNFRTKINEPLREKSRRK